MLWKVLVPWTWSKEAELQYYWYSTPIWFFVFIGVRAGELTNSYLNRGGKWRARVLFVCDIAETAMIAFTTVPVALIVVGVIVVLLVFACILSPFYVSRHRDVVDLNEAEPLIIVCNPNDPDDK